MKKTILTNSISVDDLLPETAEVVERTQILLDQATDEYNHSRDASNRAADRCVECLYQLNNSIDLHSEAHLKVEESLGKLSAYATQRQLYIALGIVGLVFFFVGYNAHG